MNNPIATPSPLMARHWWAFVLRGVLAVIFGVLVILWPGLALTTLVLVFGAYAIVDGILAIAGALSHREHYEHWWLTVIEGVIGIIAGIVAFVYPGLTALTLVYIIAFWAIFTGVLEIAAAVRLRERISNEWLLALSGVLSIVFGVLVILFPGAGALSILAIIAAYAIIFGILMIILGFRLRSYTSVGGTHAPTAA